MTTTTTKLLHATASLINADPIVPPQRRPQPPATGWSSPDSWLTKLFSGEPSTIVLALIVTLSLPVLLHLYFYTQNARNNASKGDGVPTFLLLGPSGSGKTALVSLFQKRAVAGMRGEDEIDEEVTREKQVNGNERPEASPTRLSQVATTIGMRLPPGTSLGSNKYRSENDFEVTRSKKEGAKYKIVDTPGHGKLRSEQAIAYISKPGIGLRGVIFVLDSSAMDTGAADGGEIAKDTVAYLHDVLLALQRRPKVLKKVKRDEVRVLVACNKQDLFTSLPPAVIKSRLEAELDRVKASKRKGISAVDAREDADEDEDQTVLGGGGEEKFSFAVMEEEFGVAVDIQGGSVKSDDETTGIRPWEEWIGGCL